MSDDGQSPDLQREVQRLLGRCMLRIQQYERLMKALLAHHELAGPVDTLEAQKAARVGKLADKSLGTLVKALFETYIVVEGAQQRELLDESKLPTDRISMSLRFSISMTEEGRAHTKAAVEELVAVRNDLVHHLTERFDLWSDGGCEAAIEHLMHSYGRIDRHFIELRDWARSMDSARALSASFAQSDAFKEFVVNGIAVDGSFDWRFTGVVSVLREGLQTLGLGEWASLDAVRRWVVEHHPDQSPQKYGCRTWPQVLNDSGLFEQRNRLDEEGNKVPWFRERASKQGESAISRSVTLVGGTVNY